MNPPRDPAAHNPAAVVRFWKAAGPGRWFAKDAAFDRRFRDEHAAAHDAAARRMLDDWLDSPEGVLALLLLTDQYPRNAYRGTAHMYATDSLARHFARTALDRGLGDGVEASMRLFFLLPFAHCENLSDQDLSVRLHESLGEPWMSHARGHRDIVRRFGRFPHRNALLGRLTTPEERAFLDAGGFAG